MATRRGPSAKSFENEDVEVDTCMYAVDWSILFGRRRTRTLDAGASASDAPTVAPVSPVVWSLGYTSMLTDISSEMVSSILPMYLVLQLRLSPLAFGVVDGLYQGVALLLRVAAGLVGDRSRRHKLVATLGYALSAICRLGILAAGTSWAAIAGVVAVDRTGKGIRTAPRDALITLHSRTGDLARAFGVHRALDAAGAMLGPLASFGVLMLLPGAYDAVFVISFFVAILGLGVLILFVDAPPDQAAADDKNKPNLRQALGLLERPAFRSICVGAGLLTLVTMSDAFVFLTLQDRIQFSAGLFPLLYVGVQAVNGLVAVPAGRLADRAGRLGVFVAGHVLLLIVYGTLLLPGLGLPHVVIAVVLVGCYYAMTDGVLAATAGGLLPRALCGSGLALVTTVTNGAKLAASVLFGWAWQVWGLNAALSVFIMGLATALLAAILLFRRAARPLDGTSGA
jgi:MFS family permease